MASRIRSGVSGTAAGSISWISGKPCVNLRSRRGGSMWPEKAISPADSTTGAGAIGDRTSRCRMWTFMRPGSLPAAAIEHRNFPIDELHWDGRITADTVETWSGPFRHFEISAKSVWEAPEQLAEHHQPVTAAWKFRYRYDPNILTIDAGEF